MTSAKENVEPSAHVDDADPCPCGRAREAGRCCLRTLPMVLTDGGPVVSHRTLFVAPADYRPRPPATGKSVEGCYAACLLDCDGEIEQEHFLSHGMLKILCGSAKELTVTGISWKKPEQVAQVAPKRMTAPVLCSRHNRALSPIDAVANNFFAAVHGLDVTMTALAPGERKVVAFNGHDLERWCLKALCGFVARARRPVPETWVRTLFGPTEVTLPNGLYMYTDVGGELVGQTLGLTEIVQDGVTAGMVVNMLQHELVFSMNGEEVAGLSQHSGKLRVLRPGNFSFLDAKGSFFVLWLSWFDRRFHADVRTQWASAGADPGTVT